MKRRAAAALHGGVALILGWFAVAVSAGSLPGQALPTYESSSLEALIGEAVRINALIPERLLAYRARVETEMALAVTDSAGRERTTQIEQIATDVRWRSSYRYDQRVIGYRSQSVGPTFSLMSMFGGWTTPTLYGNRLQLGVVPQRGSGAPPRDPERAFAIHPLSAQRHVYYTFAGGDTALVLFSRGRRIHVVNVRVTPRSDAPGDAVLFTGEMQLDADRRHVVRMRGRTVEIRGGKPVLTTGGGFPGASGASFIEMVNGEIDGEYWLPAYQRTEFQAHFALLGGLRVIVRIVSRFQDYRTNDSSWTGPEAPGAGHHLTFAPGDSLSRYTAWRAPLGEVSSDVEHADFGDVMPEAWRARPTGWRFRPESFSDLFRFNRIEGVYTGAAVRRDFGSEGNALTVRGLVGWAWAERTARGGVAVEKRGGEWAGGVHLQRSLAHTNDFQPALAWNATLPALLGSTDDFDYLDRRIGGVFVSRTPGPQRRSLVRLDLGVAEDREVVQNVSRGLYVEGSGFRPNRRIRPGRYARTLAVIEINPDVSGMFVDRGVGARFRFERADGDLRWNRAELRLAARRELGPLQLYARSDAGAVFGGVAPQVLFELGRSEGLTGYGYKEFVGDRAATARGVIGYTFPFWRAPMRVGEGLFVPGFAPGIAAGIQAAWTDLSSDAARAAALELSPLLNEGGSPLPLATPTDGIRSSAEFLVTFFSGAAAIGVARPLDRSGPWRVTARIGQAF